MKLSELSTQYKKDPRLTELRLTTPVLLLETMGTEAEEPWERTGSLVVGSQPAAHDPSVYFVEKVSRSGNAFLMGVTIGRVASNDISIDDSSMSRFHAWLQQDPRTQGWLLCDADSKNGTTLDGHAVEHGARVPLRDGAVMVLGHASLRFLLPQTLVQLLKG
jgi:hypothetical protein